MRILDPETAALRTWLEDGPSPSELPDVVFEAVMDQVPSVPQRRGWLPELRFPIARMVAGVGMAAAVVALATWAVVNAPRGLDFTGVGPAPTSSEDAAQAAVRQSLRFWAKRTPPAGTYFVDEPFPMRIAVTVPEDIEVWSVTSHVVAMCSPTCDPDIAGIDFWIVENGYVDPCRPTAGILDPPVGPSVDDFVDYVTAIDGVAVTDLADVSVAGYEGRYVEIRTDADVSECAAGMMRLFFSNPGELYWHAATTGSVDRLWVLDVDGLRLVIDVFSRPEAATAHVDGLESIVDSIRIEAVGEVVPPAN